jgi:hypothetical protein
VSFSLRPTTLKEANAVVLAWHRHSRPVVGCRFCLAVEADGAVVGVAIVGRPVARALQNHTTTEILRNCTDGTFNACSMLYGAAWRAWRAMGGRRMYTYTLESEDGASLRASGARIDEVLPARGNWDAPGRPRPTNTEPCPARVRWIWEAEGGAVTALK